MYQVQAHFPPIPPMDLSVHLQLAWEGIWFSTMNSAAGGPGRHTLLNVSLGETGPPTLAGVRCRCCGLGLWPVSCQKQAHTAYLQLWRFSSLLLAESSASFISLWMWAVARNVVLGVGEGIISWFFPFSGKSPPALFFLPMSLHLFDFSPHFFEAMVNLLECLSSGKPKMTPVLLHPSLREKLWPWLSGDPRPNQLPRS